MKAMHNIETFPGSQHRRSDRIRMLLASVAFMAGAGAVTAIAAGTPGAGYATIPTVAFANVGAGTSATATAVMKVLSATIAAGGTGGTDGAQVVTGTTGTGTKFQANVTIAGGIITAVNSIAVVGAYTVMPTLAGEPVTGASLTGATLNLVMGVASYTIGAGGTLYPAAGVTAVLTGGTPVTAAVPGAVTVTSAAGVPSINTIDAVAIPGLTQLPDGNFNVQFSLNKDAVGFVTNKSATGFTLTVSPRLAANTLAAGVADIVIHD